MPGDVFDRAARRSLDRLGRDVDLVNPTTAQRDSDYGDVFWSSSNTSTTSAELVRRGQPSFDKRADGVDENIDVMVWVSTAETVRTGEGDDTTAATRVDTDQDGTTDLVVRDIFDEDNGLYRLHCKEESGEPWKQ